MKISARNVMKGKITKIIPGAVNTEIVSIITKESAEGLGLAVGKNAYAIVKASNVMIGVD
jgi:molybdopterin-binding protein